MVAGKVTVTCVPALGWLFTSIEPRWASTIDFDMDRPRPLPPVRRLRAESTR